MQINGSPAPTRRRTKVLAVFAAVLALALAACSGGDDDSSSQGKAKRSTTTTTTAAPGATDTTAAPPETEAAPAAPDPCGARQLTGAEAASGIRPDIVTQTMAFSITNDSNETCSLAGYPAIELLGENDEVLVSTISQGGGAIRPELAVSTVVLDPGGQASFVASWQPVPAEGQAATSCRNVRKIRFTPPESTRATTIPARVTVCLEGLVNVSPIQPGIVTS